MLRVKDATNNNLINCILILEKLTSDKMWPLSQRPPALFYLGSVPFQVLRRAMSSRRTSTSSLLFLVLSTP